MPELVGKIRTINPGQSILFSSLHGLPVLFGCNSSPKLRKFISYNVGRFGLSLETSGAVLDSLIDLEVHGLPQDSLDSYRARVRAVGLEDVAEAARTRLHPDRAAILVLGPASELVPQLEDLAPVEVFEP